MIINMTLTAWCKLQLKGLCQEARGIISLDYGGNPSYISMCANTVKGTETFTFKTILIGNNETKPSH